MFKTWMYSEKGRRNDYKQSRQWSANERLKSFSSEDPELPYYNRDPKEIKRDPKIKQLNRQQKDILNRFTDELFIHKGFMAINLEAIAHSLELDSPQEAEVFLRRCKELEITQEENGYVFIPELREQYVRNVIKGEAKSNNSNREDEDKDEGVFY